MPVPTASAPPKRRGGAGSPGIAAVSFAAPRLATDGAATTPPPAWLFPPDRSALGEAVGVRRRGRRSPARTRLPGGSRARELAARGGTGAHRRAVAERDLVEDQRGARPRSPPQPLESRHARAASHGEPVLGAQPLPRALVVEPEVGGAADLPAMAVTVKP